MANRGRSFVPFAAAAATTAVLAVLELILRRIEDAQTLLPLLSDAIAALTPWTVTGWSTLIAPAIVVFVIATILDGLAGNR